MNRFSSNHTQKNTSSAMIISIVGFAVIIGVFLYAITLVSGTNSSGDMNNVINALDRDITHCYAVEGKYPPSVEYLEENYGLAYNKDLYIIHYEVAGDNVRPTVKVLEKNK